MKILVTGGAGYIGSHTCVDLLGVGHDVIIVDNLSNSSKVAVKRVEALAGKKVEFYNVNILDEKSLDNIFSKHKIDAVIHFAGFKAVGESVEKPLEYYENNVYGTVVLLKAMGKHNVKKIIFSSSATVYGIPKSVPVTEEFPLSTLNPYGETKLMCERILTDWQKTVKNSTVILLRYFNPVGSHKSGLLGEEPSDIPNNIMPYIVRVASGKYEKITIFGDDYDTKDGTGVRDYIHVLDLSMGHVKALEWAEENRGIGIFNLGKGLGYSVLDLIKTFEKVVDKKIPYVVGKRRNGDAAIVYGSSEKAKKILGWEAQYGIEDMCKDSWKFVEMNPNGFEK